MDIVIKREYQAKLELLTSKLELLPDEQFDMRVTPLTKSGCGCIEAHVSSFVQIHSYRPLVDFLGPKPKEADHITFGFFLKKRYRQ